MAIAAANILRAEALIQQARAATLPTISAEASNVTLDSARENGVATGLEDRFSSMEEFRKGLLGEIKVASAPGRAPAGMGKRPAVSSGPRQTVATTMSPQAQSTTLRLMLTVDP